MKKEDILEMKIELSESEREQLDLAERLIAITIISPKDISWNTPLRNFLDYLKGFYHTSVKRNLVKALNAKRERIRCIVFNEKEAHLYGIEITGFDRKVEFAIQNAKFKVVPGDERIPRYDLETAKEKFPFLFKE